MGGHDLGGVCDHINHFGYNIKEIRLLKAWGPAKLKGPGENTEPVIHGYKWLCYDCLMG